VRRQPPAHSPITLAAIGAGVRGVIVGPGDASDHLSAMLCQSYRAGSVLLVNSGTAALQLALRALRTIDDRPVALPAYSCYDLATAAVGAGIRVVLYDLDAATLGPDRASLARALEQRPAAVVAAHLYGYPVDMEWLATQCPPETVLIEDAAQAAGGSLRSRPLGSFGSLTVLSFGRGKGTTGGSGGALLAHDDRGAALLQAARSSLPAAGRGAKVAMLLTAQWALARPALYWLPAALPFLRLGETVYRAPGRPGAMTSAATRALVHTARPEVIATARAARSVVARRLSERARSSARVRTIGPVAGAEPGYLRLPLLAAEAAAPVVGELQPYGVARGYPLPLAALQPLQRWLVNGSDGFAGAQRLAEHLVTFPTHQFLSQSDLVALESWLA
jgi:dTDP-4-amino-4,6-dideoxygalactose transaminase